MSAGYNIKLHKRQVEMSYRCLTRAESRLIQQLATPDDSGGSARRLGKPAVSLMGISAG